MKTLSGIFMLLLMVTGLSAQTFEFTYDAAGNRTKRQVVVLKSLENTDTTANEEMAPVPENVGEMTVSVFPNPVEQRLHVNITNLPADAVGKLELFDVSGRLITSRNNLSSLNSIDMSRQIAGNYILRITAGNEQKEWKVLKN